MAVDTPAKIAIVGAGPVGLEAALYARFLGYEVEIFELGVVADAVARRGHLKMFTPFGQNRSPLGLAALQAQDEGFCAPAFDEMLSLGQWREKYLLPLSQVDLLADHIREQTEVVAIGREGVWKKDLIDDESRGDYLFRLLVRTKDGREQVCQADVVFDATGAGVCPRWCGQGGIPALGEMALRNRIDYHVPDVLGSERNEFADRNTLVIGTGLSAASTIVALAKLAGESSNTRVTWLSRHPLNLAANGPVCSVGKNPPITQAALIDAANKLSHCSASKIEFVSDTVVNSLAFKEPENHFVVELLGERAGTFIFDRVVANVGFQPCKEMTVALNVDFAPTDAISSDSIVESREPHFYFLGARRTPGEYDSSLEPLLVQVRDLFRIIGDRPALDLYANAPTRL